MPYVTSEHYAYAFIDSGMGVHFAIKYTSPFLTLCNLEFKKSDIPRVRKRVVTCPRCVEIVLICKDVEVDDRTQQKS
jgi:hypothetical protein